MPRGSVVGAAVADIVALRVVQFDARGIVAVNLKIGKDIVIALYQHSSVPPAD